MLRILLIFFCLSVLGTSCLKNDRGCPYTSNDFLVPQMEQSSLETFLDTNGIDAIKHPSGFYYSIVNSGTGNDSFGLCTEIQIDYTGKLANDSTFDSGKNVFFVLGGLIEGWRRGIPLIKKGGELNLYIPPSLGYGGEAQKDKYGNVVVPSNSILIFNVKLLDYRLYN